MVRQRQQRSRCARYPARWQRAFTWAPGIGLSIALLAVLGWAVGRDDSHPDSFTDAIVAGASTPGAAITLAFLAIVLAALCIRNLWLNWLAWWPGAIEIELHIPKELDAEAEALRHGFTSRISTLRLQMPSAVPGAAPEGDFLDTLGRRGLDEGSLATSVVTLLRAAFPSHGYRIEGDVALQPGPAHCSMTIRVTRLPGEGYPPIECRGASWDAVTRQAADEATAYILPQTRRCRDPWRAWRGYVMPGRLLHEYEEGTHHEQARRYDEALACYYAALKHDPLNMAVRLQLGKLQEKMGLYIDALATYQAMCQVDGSDDGRHYKRTYSRSARAERKRAMLAAMYRGAVLLGGSELASQWCKGERPDGSGKRRYEQRKRLRLRLIADMRREIAGLGEPVAGIKWIERRGADDAGARKALETCPLALRSPISELSAPGINVEACLTHVNAAAGPDATELALRQLLAIVALRRSARLWATAPRWSHRVRALNRATVELTALCIRERLSWLQRGDDWTLGTPEIKRQIGAIERRGLRRAGSGGFRHWHEHYNAACALALPLVPRGRKDDELAAAAVDRLALATARADSAYLAGRRDWLVSEDPDLDGLRRTAEFKRFEAVYFPTPAATPQREGAVRHLENARYVVELMSDASRRWQAEWTRRMGDETPAWTTEVEWFADEQEAWGLIGELACEYTDTRTRLGFLERMRGWGDRYGFAAVTAGVPRYEDGPVPAEPGVEKIIAWCDERMEHVVGAAAAMATASGIARPGRDGLLSRLPGTGRDAHRVRLDRLSAAHAEAWHLLREWLDVTAPDTAGSERAEGALAGAAHSLEALAAGRLPVTITQAPALAPDGRFTTRRLPSWLAR
jgi:hypothetical protein